MPITNNYLNIFLKPTSTFDGWNYNRLSTPLIINSTFQGERQNNFVTKPTIHSDFTYLFDHNRVITTPLTVRSTFSGYVLSLTTPNNDVPPVQQPIFDIPDPLPPTIDRPTVFQDGGSFKPYEFILYRNSTSGVPAISLPAPDFGDTDEYNQIKELKYSRGNTLILFDDPLWGYDRVFEWAFSNLNKEQRTFMLLFLENSLGQKVALTDHLGFYRVGYILNPESALVETGPGMFAFTIRFQQVS